ncbi:MAG: LptF/LptG family permease [Planctomycetia bacterium]|nr:LptF/LptG family permease [Planctomycetia bacterium]
MKIITQYVLGRIFKIFFIVLALSSLGLSLYFVTEATIKMGVPIHLSLKLVPYIIPNVMCFTIPGAILLAATSFCAQMNGANELIALKAMGIPPWRIFMPVWIFVLILSLFAVWINDSAGSWGRKGMAKVVVEGLETTILSKLRETNRFATTDNRFLIEVSDIDDEGNLIDAVFTSTKYHFSGTADKARLIVDFNKPNPVLTIRLNNADIQSEAGNAILPNDFEYEIPLNELGFNNYRVDPSMSQIDEELAKLEAKRSENQRKIAAKTAFSLMSGNYNYFGDKDWRNRKYLEEDLNYKRNRFLLTKPRLWASGFSSFFFVWVGIPFALWSRRTDYFSSFFACFIPILLVYYPLLMFGFQGAKAGTLSPMFAWSGNIVLGIIGFWFLNKIHQH